MWPIETYIYVMVSCFIAGGVKGLIGLGFPTIIIAMLSLKIGVREAMAIMLLPCFLTNFWQAISGGNLTLIIRRIWPLLLTASLTIWFTTAFVASINSKILTGLLGIVVFSYAILGLVAPRIRVIKKHEIWLAPATGFINGIIGGLTGNFVVPAVLYLQSLQLGKDCLVQAMGVLFLVSTAALGSGLFNHELLSNQFLRFSAMAIIPSFAGMAIGQLIRKTVSERDFQRIFFLSLLLLGSYIFIRNLL